MYLITLLIVLALSSLKQSASFQALVETKMHNSVLAESTSKTTSNNVISSEITFKNVKAVIFDIDGTIADSGKLGFDATNVVLMNNNIGTITLDEYLEGCRYTTPVRLARHCGLSIENDKSEFESVGQKLGKEFDEFYINLVSMETASFFPGILQLIECLPSNVVLGALTNAAGLYAHAVLKANSVDASSTQKSIFNSPAGEGSLYNRFGSILGADEVPKPKPYADGLLMVCEELRISPKDCVYVGDASSDGMAAQAAGMPAIGVTWGANTEESLRASNVFNRVCKSVEELRSILPQINE